MMTPRIAIPVPTTRDLAYNQRSQPAYAQAIERSGGEPVEIPLTTTSTALQELLTTCHGVCLPGSPADVDPALYAADRDPASAPADQAREAMDRALLEDAQAHGKPVLAICYGVQFLNVWLGGTLVQDLAPVPVNHEAGSKVAVAHTALVAPASLLAALTDPTELAPDAPPTPDAEFGDFLRLPINTSHHQAIGAPGDGLHVVARCPDDGVIEAVELDPSSGKLFPVEQSAAASRGTTGTPAKQAGWFVLGVQWHPERSYDISPTSRALFTRLIAEARRVA